MNYKTSKAPLSEIMRPERLDEIIGQQHLFDEFGILTAVKNSKTVPSMILQGPSGIGKTTIAKALAHEISAKFIAISAINSGVADIKKIIEEAKSRDVKRLQRDDLFNNSIADATNHSSRPVNYNSKNDSESNSTQTKFERSANLKTVLMIDEIHHFNKTQQDLFLPFIEDGTIILIATTTENPSFHINSALLSRCRVVVLTPLQDEDLEKILQRCEEKTQEKIPLNIDARAELINMSCGDARYLLNAVEQIYSLKSKTDLDVEKLKKLIARRAASFDKKGDVFYNLISAFHKSLRGSDVDASLYYLARMLVAGQDPYYILRRMARFATEDVGLADPDALLQVMAAKENYDFLGSPEGDYALSHAAIYLACAPKSNASYIAHKAAIEAAQNSTAISPPQNILNAPTKLMKEQGLGAGYIYDHDSPNAFSGQEFFPTELLKKQRPKFYNPNERGFEREIKKRLKYWDELRQKNC